MTREQEPTTMDFLQAHVEALEAKVAKLERKYARLREKRAWEATVAAMQTLVRSSAEQTVDDFGPREVAQEAGKYADALLSVFESAPAQPAAAVEALKAIAKKRPQDVSREEAADMACEFVLLARQALREIGEG